MATWDYLSKFVIVGDSGVGKSSLLVRLTDDRFLADADPTVGVEFGSHLLTMRGGERVKVQVWDTAGSEAFRSITRSYYRGAAGALLVYSVAHRPSFLHVADWLRDVRANAEETVSIVLVGNMRDLCGEEEGEQEEEESPEQGADDDGEGGQGRQGAGGADPSLGPSDAKVGRMRRKKSRPRLSGDRREVSRQEAREFAQREGIMFVETSAKTGENVHEAFYRAAADIHAKFVEARSHGGAAGGGAGSAALMGSLSRKRGARLGGDAAAASGRSRGGAAALQLVADPASNGRARASGDGGGGGGGGQNGACCSIM